MGLYFVAFFNHNQSHISKSNSFWLFFDWPSKNFIGTLAEASICFAHFVLITLGRQRAVFNVSHNLPILLLIEQHQPFESCACASSHECVTVCVLANLSKLFIWVSFKGDCWFLKNCWFASWMVSFNLFFALVVIAFSWIYGPDVFFVLLCCIRILNN